MEKWIGAVYCFSVYTKSDAQENLRDATTSFSAEIRPSRRYIVATVLHIHFAVSKMDIDG